MKDKDKDKDGRKNKGKNKLPDIDIDEIMRQAKLAALMGRDLAEEDGIPSEEEMEAELEFSEEFLKKEAEMLKALTGLDSFEAVKEDLKKQADAKDEKKQVEKRAMDALYNEEESIPFGPDSPEFEEILKKGINEYFKIQAKHIPSREQLDAQYEFSEEYQKKKEKQLFRKLGYKAPREKRRFSEFYKIAAVIAIMVIVFVGTSNTASAFRLNIIEKVTKIFSAYTRHEYDNTEISGEAITFDIPELDGYTLEVIEDGEGLIVVEYTSIDYRYLISFTIEKDAIVKNFDNSVENRTITVNDASGNMILTDGMIYIVWYRDSYVFSARSYSEINENEMLRIVEEFDQKGKKE